MKDVTILDVNGYKIGVYPLDLVDGLEVHFEEPGDVNNGYFSLKFDGLMNALHEAGLPVKGWKPKPTLEKAKEEALYEYLVLKAPQVGSEVATQEILNIIKRVEEEYK